MQARLAAVWMAGMIGAGAAPDFTPENSQAPGEDPPPGAEVVAGMRVPDGFAVDLFAEEPEVRQPVAMEVDAWGRVWVAESYSYGEWARKGQDRIVVLEDGDRDGRAEGRRVFWEGGNHLSGFVLGHGGVWICDAPRLLFVPDPDGDGVADGAGEVILDGWTTEASHNMVNGLKWGPDGWLYGHHGILATSRVGRPGVRAEDRVAVSCGIWRYHPRRGHFEVVARGMTNPWGSDWDAHGELFASGNVNGHLWHIVPGAFYERMYGEGEEPDVYGRLVTSAERPHHAGDDWRADWNRSSLGRDSGNRFGGGHSHCGALFYQGVQWPERFRGALFMSNTHGRRVNMDRITASGSGYTGRYEGDLLTVGTPWFRGVTLAGAPDGSVFLSDWVDAGECHDQDGVHRTSGRVYRIRWGVADAGSSRGPGRDSAAALLEGLRGRDGWRARRVIQDFHEMGDAAPLREEEWKEVEGILVSGEAPEIRLRALWVLRAAGRLGEREMLELATDADPFLRMWAVRYLCWEEQPGAEALELLAVRCREEPSPRVRVELAGAVQRVPGAAAWEMAEGLAGVVEDGADPRLPLMVWFGIKDRAGEEPLRAVELAGRTAWPVLHEFVARRVAGEWARTEGREAADRLVAAGLDGSAVGLEAVLTGLAEAWKGRREAPAPARWSEAADRALRSGSERARSAAIALAAIFGDRAILDRLREAASAAGRPPGERRLALESLVEAGAPGLESLCLSALEEPELRLTALRGLARASGSQPAEIVLRGIAGYSPEERRAAVRLLAGREEWAALLLGSLEAGTLSPRDLPASEAQRIAALGAPALVSRLEAVWGRVRLPHEAKQAEIDRLGTLVEKRRGEPFDVERGGRLYRERCGVCHRLHGEGGKAGPDLTGSGRGDPAYLISNIFDPSAVVPEDYRLATVQTRDGRVLAGVLREQSRDRVVVQDLAEEHVLPRPEVERIGFAEVSLMPEGLLTGLSDEEIRDLLLFLGEGAPGEDGGR